MSREDGVREIAGVHATGSATKPDVWLRLSEQDGTVSLDSTYADAYLTVAQARKLARQLYRLARRVEKRKETQ